MVVMLTKFILEYSPAMKSATELHAPIFIGNIFWVLNSVLSKQNVLFCAEINQILANIPDFLKFGN